MSNRKYSILIRGLIVVVALGLSLLALQERSRRVASMVEIHDILQHTGVGRMHQDETRRIERELDPQWARLDTARILTLESGEAPGALEDGSGMAQIARKEHLEERLKLAGELAAAVGQERPAVWQASMWKGATNYLRWSVAGDARILTQRSEWERPLLHSIELAPGRPYPFRFLAAAYLEIWPVLKDRELTAAKEILHTAMMDRNTLKAFVGPWLARASSLDEAFEVIPDDPNSWSLLRSYFGNIRDYPAFSRAHQHWIQSVHKKLAELVVDLKDVLSGGDLTGARRLAASVVALAPPDRRFVSFVSEAISSRPPGRGASSELQGAKLWLKWGLEAFVRGRALLPPVAFDRFAADISGLSDAEEATAMLAAGNMTRAETIERRHEDLNTESWGPYCLAKARLELGNADRQAARRFLERMSPTMYRIPEAKRLKLLLHQGEKQNTRWWTALPDLVQDDISGVRWKWDDREAWMDFVSQDGNGLSLALDIVPSVGAVVELQLDFQTVWADSVQAGDMINLNCALKAGPHTLRFRRLAGGKVVPGDVSITGARDRASQILSS